MFNQETQFFDKIINMPMKKKFLSNLQYITLEVFNWKKIFW